MREHKKRNLNSKTRLGLVMFAVIILVLATIFVGIDSYYSEREEYSQIAISSAAAASFIDGDRVLDYLEVVGTDADGKAVYYRDDYYEEVQTYLDSFHHEFDLIKYYYVLVPFEDHITYIWDASSYYPQGYSKPYEEEEFDAIHRAFSREPENTIVMRYDAEWGNSSAAFFPIYYSNGDPVAEAGVDLSVSGLTTIFIHSLLTIILAVIIAIGIAFFIAYKLINKNLIQPIEQLSEATKTLVDELGTGEHFDLDIHTGDELEELADNFGRMDTDLQEYPHSPPVGALEKTRFRDHGFQLYPGDTLFIYSDGVRDAMNEQLELFGKHRVIKALNQDPEATPNVLLQIVKSEIGRFTGAAPQQDDLSMLCLKYYGSDSEKKTPAEPGPEQ